MYRCTECKEEFKEKPDYCTCGNDEFEEFTAPPVKDSTFQQEQQPLPHKNFDFKKFDMAKVFSIGFFCLCLILAVIPFPTSKAYGRMTNPRRRLLKLLQSRSLRQKP